MEGAESVLESIYEEVVVCGDETLENDGVLEDVEMLDAETLDGRAGSTAACGDKGREAAPAEGGCRGKNQRRRSNKKKGKKRKSGSSASITDINRFVIDTCKHLKEKKSYLVWNAVGSLGVSAVSDLVKEVDAIHGCGGQRTADGRRFRTGGGILWNILKTREPKAYKEIMAKGREFEKQFREPKAKRVPNRSDESIPPSENASDGAAAGGESTDGSDPMPRAPRGGPAPSDDSNTGGRGSVLDRIRVPVTYGDLFEEDCPLSLVVRWDFFRKGMYLLPLALHMALIFHLARTCM